MATDKNTLKNWFKTGLKPTQSQFWAWLDAFWHKDEQIPQSAISNLTTVLNAKAEKLQFDSHKTDPNAHANLIAIARIIPVGGLLVFKVDPDTDQNAKTPGDYCIGLVEGSFIGGNWNGGNDQLKSSYT
ncbi:MAG: hypothetical protein ABIP27_16560 [Flavobacterium circumlabens]|uniref:hypothetical protein n=1 Tax=Flavobacterium circumlabens TaxID=2133765 RepID=UPI00326669DE